MGGGRHKFKSLDKTGGVERVQRSGRGADKEHTEEEYGKHDWGDEESKKASWRREHLSFLSEDESILALMKGSLEGTACGEQREEWAWEAFVK